MCHKSLEEPGNLRWEPVLSPISGPKCPRWLSQGKQNTKAISQLLISTGGTSTSSLIRHWLQREVIPTIYKYFKDEKRSLKSFYFPSLKAGLACTPCEIWGVPQGLSEHSVISCVFLFLICFPANSLLFLALSHPFFSILAVSLTFLFLSHQDPFLTCVSRPFVADCTRAYGDWVHCARTLDPATAHKWSWWMCSSLLSPGLEAKRGFCLTGTARGSRQHRRQPALTSWGPHQRGSFPRRRSIPTQTITESKTGCSHVWMPKQRMMQSVEQWEPREYPGNRRCWFQYSFILHWCPRPILLSLPAVQNSVLGR